MPWGGLGRLRKAVGGMGRLGKGWAALGRLREAMEALGRLGKSTIIIDFTSPPTRSQFIKNGWY